MTSLLSGTAARMVNAPASMTWGLAGDELRFIAGGEHGEVCDIFGSYESIESLKDAQWDPAGPGAAEAVMMIDPPTEWSLPGSRAYIRLPAAEGATLRCTCARGLVTARRVSSLREWPTAR